MINRYMDIECDGCGTANDGDPINFIGIMANTYGIKNPAKIKELQHFWLCRDCAEGYPNGAKDFFIPEYFEDIPVCASCEDDEVDEWGHLCDYCDEQVPSV